MSKADVMTPFGAQLADYIGQHNQETRADVDETMFKWIIDGMSKKRMSDLPMEYNLRQDYVRALDYFMLHRYIPVHECRLYIIQSGKYML